MKKTESPFPERVHSWEGKFLAQSIFLDIFTFFLNIPCHLIPVDRQETWHIINGVYPKASPLDYESTLELTKSRVQYNQKAFQKVIRSRKPLCVSHMGLYGMFVPLLEKKRCTAILQAGVFLKQLPVESEVVGQWKKLTGRLPKAQDREFSEYARLVLELPILGAMALGGLQEAMEQYAGLLAGERDWRQVHARLNELRRSVFAPELSHRYWVEAVSVHKKFFRQPQYVGKLMDWEKEELGLTRFPTTVLAVKREGTGGELADLFSARELQGESFQAVRKLEESVSYPLSHYGSLVLTSSPDSFSPSQAKGDFKVKAEGFGQGAFKKIKGGRFHRDRAVPIPGVSGLMDSYLEAVAALHLAESSKTSPWYFSRTCQGIDMKESSLRKAPGGIGRGLLRGRQARTAIHRRHFVEKVLMGTGERRVDPTVPSWRPFTASGRPWKNAGHGTPALTALEAELEESVGLGSQLNEMVEGFERSH